MWRSRYVAATIVADKGGMSALAAISPTQRILVVEDDKGLREETVLFLREYGYEVYAVESGGAMQTVMAAAPIDLVILDVMLPGEDGLSICRRMSEQGDAAIVIVSARGEQVDRIVGLELGADDYLAKPFAPRELLARVRAVLRRRASSPDRTSFGESGFAFAGFRFDVARRHLRAPNGATIALTRAEAALLGALADNAGHLVSRNQLIEEARGADADVFDRSIDVLVSRLRRKLQGCGASDLIKTIRGAGYIFDVKVSRL